MKSEINVWHYRHGSIGNIGDELGPYLIGKISGRVVNFIDLGIFLETVVSIGSVFHFPLHSKCNIWGSGVISEAHVPERVDGRIYAVRGPLTRIALMKNGIEVPRVVGDPGLLLPNVYEPKVEKRFEVGFIPHYVDQVDFMKRSLESSQNTKMRHVIIDITGFDVERFVRTLCMCDIIISSSLHGLIIAHAYGIPAVRMTVSDKITGGDFKFNDYFLSVSIPIHKAIDIRKGNIDLERLKNFAVHANHINLPINFDKNPLIKTCPFA